MNFMAQSETEESKDFRLAIHHGTQKRTDLSIESWIVDGENL
jgi:hypothetical protein